MAKSNKKKAAAGKGKTRTGARAKKSSASNRRVLPFLLKWTATAAVWGIVLLAGVVIFYAHDLPSVDDALETSRRPTVTILDRHGEKIAGFGELHGAAVQVKDLPPYLPRAVVATEDRRFYEHPGVDLIGIARAAVMNVKAGRIVQGGSTITQQAAKKLFLGNERTFKRKVQELLLALWLEQKFTKDQILTIYLNRVYLGAGAYGVSAAAERYFGRSPRHVSLYQAALIAGLLKAPSTLNPARNPDGAAKRARVVLANMVKAGYITQAQAAVAGKGSATLAKVPRRTRLARYFADWIVEQLPSFVGAQESDLAVKTTLDAALQRRAERRVAATMKAHAAKDKVSQVALVTLAMDGAVRAMVGGRNYNDSQFNRAVQARRQPGSAFKPFVYLAALESGLSPESLMIDEPITIGKWRPRNYDGQYHGPMTLAEGLRRSTNTIAVQAAEKAGRNRVIAVAKRLGVGAKLVSDPTLALGTSEVSLLELSAAYTPFANGGEGVFGYGILEIHDSAGGLVYRRQGSGPGRVIAPDKLSQMNSMLAGVLAQGTGRAAYFGRPAGGKTGTSQDFRDAWFVGYTAHYVTGIWMGNDNSAPTRRVTGGGAPAKLWRAYMSDIHQGLSLAGLPGANRPSRAPADTSSSSPSFWERLVDQLTGG